MNKKPAEFLKNDVVTVFLSATNVAMSARREGTTKVDVVVVGRRNALLRKNPLYIDIMTVERGVVKFFAQSTYKTQS